MATFLHSRQFLSYHGDRFKDQSLIVVGDDEEWLGLFLAATSPTNSSQIVSHPGITYGGLLHRGKLIGADTIEALERVAQYYKSTGFSEIIYKAVPSFYHKTPSCDDLYALYRLNARLYRRDLSCTIDLTQPSTLSNKAQSKMRNMMRKAEKNQVSICLSSDNLEDLWEILNLNLQEKYKTRPVHSYKEIKDLIEKFPNNVQVVSARINKEIVAGAILFKTEQVIHTQYLINTEKGMDNFALDMIIQFCINRALEESYRFFDFGINNEQQGQYLNHSLYLSKVKHGGTGAVHDFYSIDLE